MSLNHKITFLSQDISGRELELKDSTGLKENGSKRGYSPQNLKDILGYALMFSRIRSSVVLKTFIMKDDPFYRVDRIARGFPFKVSNKIFKEKYHSHHYSSEVFKDGVLDINSYVILKGKEDVVGKEGDSFITGGDFRDIEGIDAVVSGEDVYNVDDVQYDVGGAIIYLAEPLKEDITSFSIAYRSNIKALLQSSYKNRMAYASDVISRMSDTQRSMRISDVHTADIFASSAIHLFTQGDYYKSDRLTVAAVKLLSKYTI